MWATKTLWHGHQGDNQVKNISDQSGSLKLPVVLSSLNMSNITWCQK